MFTKEQAHQNHSDTLNLVPPLHQRFRKGDYSEQWPTKPRHTPDNVSLLFLYFIDRSPSAFSCADSYCAWNVKTTSGICPVFKPCQHGISGRLPTVSVFLICFLKVTYIPTRNISYGFFLKILHSELQRSRHAIRNQKAFSPSQLYKTKVKRFFLNTE